MRKPKLYRGYRPFTLHGIFLTIGLLILLAMWFFILLNPVIFMIHYMNPLYLLLYVLIVPEFFVGALISGLIFKILDV
jgi:hypothetical protein